MELTPRQQLQGRFWKKYLRLTRAGVPALHALEILHDEEQDPAFRQVIARIQAGLQEGLLLSEAMAGTGDVFSLSSREMIRTAEKGGQWDLVLEELADGLLEGTFD
jgi:type II secretory pathway component PulF